MEYRVKNERRKPVRGTLPESRYGMTMPWMRVLAVNMVKMGKFKKNIGNREDKIY